ncbi:hypothetical protein KJ951_02805 [Patescibacteria group bacterium]|nr:hypothetical protein [Patescibacteria group bacterium]MBU1703310.1 hypothetical protein [Patescibacteria group bacterium]MBU1954383.1 hypothetical protein [Patescibacteria group bacterium]
MRKGAFITLYGINNIGKSTHAKRLVERLNKEGYDAVYIKYPIYDLQPTGPQINEILRSDGEQQVSEKDLQMLFRENRRDFEPQLQEMLSMGKIVVAEDYTQTGIAWGTAKGLDEVWMEDLNRGLLEEDFSILLVGERSLNAVEPLHRHESNEDLIRHVDEILRQRAKDGHWKVVHLQRHINDTAKLIWDAVEKFLHEFGARSA